MLLGFPGMLLDVEELRAVQQVGIGGDTNITITQQLMRAEDGVLTGWLSMRASSPDPARGSKSNGAARS